MIFTKIFRVEKILNKIIFHLLVKPLLYVFSKDIVHGVQTTFFLAYSDDKDLVNGGYYSDITLEKYTPVGRDEKLRNEMISETLKILNVNIKN